MKFSDGLWASRPGYKLHTPKMLLEYQLTQDSIHAYALCHPIQEPEDYTGGVSLEYTFTAPREDMIQVRIRHFSGGLDRGPRFQLNTCPGAGRAQESESALILRSGRARLELDKEGPFAYRFYYDDTATTRAPTCRWATFTPPAMPRPSMRECAKRGWRTPSTCCAAPGRAASATALWSGPATSTPASAPCATKWRRG